MCQAPCYLDIQESASSAVLEGVTESYHLVEAKPVVMRDAIMLGANPSHFTTHVSPSSHFFPSMSTDSGKDQLRPLVELEFPSALV